MSRLAETRLATVVEAVFALELDDPSWLLGVLSALTQLSNAEYQYLGFFYDTSGDRQLELWNVCASNASLELESAMLTGSAGFESLRSTLRGLPAGGGWTTGSPGLGPLQLDDWANLFQINCPDPSGISCLLLIGCRTGEPQPEPAELAMYQRVASHLVTAFRCRRRMGSSGAGAGSAPPPRTMLPSPELEAAAARTKVARERLRKAGVVGGTVHAKRQSPAWQKALNELQPSLGTHLTLVDTFEENGSLYIVAREGGPCALGIDRLTERERQIVEHAALGFTNKEIASALGISDATVRVLMARAARRVGVHSRRELLAHPAVLTRRPLPPQARLERATAQLDARATPPASAREPASAR